MQNDRIGQRRISIRTNIRIGNRYVDACGCIKRALCFARLTRVVNTCFGSFRIKGHASRHEWQRDSAITRTRKYLVTWTNPPISVYTHVLYLDRANWKVTTTFRSSFLPCRTSSLYLSMESMIERKIKKTKKKNKKHLSTEYTNRREQKERKEEGTLAEAPTMIRWHHRRICAVTRPTPLCTLYFHRWAHV